jgi:hypothetical protein
MKNDQRLNLVADRIMCNAQTQGIDFADPVNAFTVWAGLSHGPQYCGSRKVLDDAWMLAAAHVNLKDLYVVKGPLDAFGIMRFERG